MLHALCNSSIHLFCLMSMLQVNCPKKSKNNLSPNTAVFNSTHCPMSGAGKVQNAVCRASPHIYETLTQAEGERAML
jgi:hypothetical protein